MEEERRIRIKEQIRREIRLRARETGRIDIMIGEEETTEEYKKRIRAGIR